MNSNYKSNPEIIATVRAITKEGDDTHKGDFVAGIQVMSKEEGRQAIVQIDLRNYSKQANLIIEVELHELVSALSMATLNSERN
jgi:hypothetical protein